MNPKAIQPPPIIEKLGGDPLPQPWAAFFEGVYRASQPQGGTTAQRPVSPVIYQPFFDTTLGYQIICKAVTPAVVWVNGAGTTV